MNDLSKCEGHGCPIKDHCGRFLTRNDGGELNDFRYSEDGCEYFIEVKRE